MIGAVFATSSGFVMHAGRNLIAVDADGADLWRLSFSHRRFDDLVDIQDFALTPSGRIVTAGTEFNGNENDIAVVQLQFEGEATAASVFLRGDSDANGALGLGDAVVQVLELFRGRALRCGDASDTNDDGVLTVADPVFLLNYLFRSGERPPVPYPEAGVDATPDRLFDCET